MSAVAQYATLLSPATPRRWSARYHWLLSGMPTEILDEMIYDWVQSQSDRQYRLIT